MIAIFATVLGGIGLFLLGMILMTDGLKQAAGETLQQILRRFTGTPSRSLLSGAGITAVVQSSSATTVTTIGFVSAGLLTFPQALGLILGANLGSTSTGWLVSVLGLKLSIGTITLPLVGVGALVYLLARRNVAPFGLAIAGFGLIFVGIDVLQTGTSGLAEQFDLTAYDDTFLGRLVLIAIGFAMTVIMQSSSAAVATTLTALHSGAIGLEQAAALVIGQNLGTTVKAALVSIGATIPAKRTALAHILFNGITGLVAFAMLPLFVALVANLPGLTGGDEALIIAAFHTAFNLIGIIIFLPIIHPFSRWVERLLPDPEPTLLRHLQPGLVEVPEVALDATEKTLREVMHRQLGVALARLDGDTIDTSPEDFEEVDHALKEIRLFIGELSSPHISERAYQTRLRLLHTTDHLERLNAALRHKKNMSLLRTDEETKVHLEKLRNCIRQTRATIENTPYGSKLRSNDVPDAHAQMNLLERTIQQNETCSSQMRQFRKERRALRLEETAAGAHRPSDVLMYIDALRWIDRLAYHLWRATNHLLLPPSQAGNIHQNIDTSQNDAEEAFENHEL